MLRLGVKVRSGVHFRAGAAVRGEFLGEFSKVPGDRPPPAQAGRSTCSGCGRAVSTAVGRLPPSRAKSEISDGLSTTLASGNMSRKEKTVNLLIGSHFGSYQPTCWCLPWPDGVQLCKPDRADARGRHSCLHLARSRVCPSHSFPVLPPCPRRGPRWTRSQGTSSVAAKGECAVGAK